jgi:Protein of unknown function (DUF2442)
MIKIRKAEFSGNYRIALEFSTGETGEIDLSELISRDGTMVQPLRDERFFRAFFVEMGALSWPNGFDLSPSALYKELAAKGLLLRPSAA